MRARPTALVSGVKEAIAQVNRDVSLQFKTLAVQVDESLARERLLATLSGFFGGLALVLAMIGLYGVMSYNVARRRNEIGIRMALGAEQSRVLRMVLGEVAILDRDRAGDRSGRGDGNHAVCRELPLRDEAERSLDAFRGAVATGAGCGRGWVSAGTASVAAGSDDGPAGGVRGIL